MERIRLAGIVPLKDGFAFMHRVGVEDHPIGDYYTFPGGGREGEEVFEDGVKREIKEEFGIDVDVKELLYESESIDQKDRRMKEYFYLCKYVSGVFGTGDGPEFNNDPAYAHRGKFLPEIVKRDDVEKILLLPPKIRDKFVEDMKKGRFDI